jgi:hypothetical protein
MSESWTRKFILPGTPNKPIISTPDRPDRTLSSVFGTFLQAGSGGLLGGIAGPAGEAAEDLAEGTTKLLGISANEQQTPGKARTLVALAPDQLGVPGEALAGYLWSAPDNQKQMPPYNSTRYRQLLSQAQSIANQYGLRVTSGYRPGSIGANGQLDMHSVGLAFDMVGIRTNEKRAATWASENPGIFQEVFIHNEGSGVHLHLAFYPDAASILSSTANKYAQGTSRARLT